MTERTSVMNRVEKPESRTILLSNKPCRNAKGYTMQFDIAEVVSLSTNKTRMRKILTYIWRHRWDWVSDKEDKYDALIQSWINYSYQTLYEQWGAASLAFQEGYQEVKFGHTVDGRTVPYTPKETRRILAKNRRLHNTVLTAKYQYEKYKDRINIWNDIKEKYPRW